MIRLIIDKLVPLILYFSIYILVLFLVQNAENLYKGLRIRSANRYMVAAVMILCLFAALRAETVGTDVLVYAKPTFDEAKYTGVPLFSWLITQENIAYSLLAYISAKVFNSFSTFLFLTELCVVAPLAACMVKNRKSASITITMLVFLALYYPMTFNIMRQSIAVSFLLLGYFYFKEKKTIKTIASLIVAFAFHSSVVIMLAMLLVVHYIGQIKKKSFRFFLLLVAAIVAVFVFTQWQSIMQWAIYDIGILPTRFGFYLQVFSGNINREYFFTSGLSTWIDVIVRLCNFVLLLVLGFIRKDNSRELSFYRYAALLNISIYVITYAVFKSTYGYRIVMCFDFMNCFYFATMASEGVATKRTLTKLTIKEVIICFYSVCCWFLMYFVAGMHEVFPYVFAGL